MSQDQMEEGLSIPTLPTIVALLFARANRPLVDEERQPRFFVRYLRRKPERGLAIIYAIDTGTRRSTTSHSLHNTVSVTLDEQALRGSHILFSAQQAQTTLCTLNASGVVQATALGLSLQAFPADNSLPALAICCDTTSDSPLWHALQTAAQYDMGEQHWRLVAAQAYPVRYKPTNRCVIRYSLMLEHAHDKTLDQRHITIFGKVYADKQQAHAIQTVQQALYKEQVAIQQQPLLPKPLGINETLGITFNEAIQPADPGELMQTGGRTFRPHIIYGRGGEVIDIIVPIAELQRTAHALACLHTSMVQPHKLAPRTGAKEAMRVRERAQRIAEANPTLAEAIHTLAQRLTARLETQQPINYTPAHGGFKASQLLFHSQRVFVVDFDGFCLADAALDVGYFLAYLRPSGLWYRRPGISEWFAASATIFLIAYQQAMSTSIEDQTLIAGIAQRSKLYEAALLFKIATRRVNRLNSPRPQELAAQLREIATCLVDA